MSQRGFTLMEVLVALSITAVALMAGLKAVSYTHLRAHETN
jgi:prepilin-type N-terminal cleavage/methylation domain-containing protein